MVKRPAGTQPTFSNLDGARCSVESQEEDEEEEVKEEEEGDRCEEERRKEEVVSVGAEDGFRNNQRHPNPLNRARERRRARLEAELKRPPEGQECPRWIDRERPLGKNEKLSVDCFCGQCD